MIDLAIGALAVIVIQMALILVLILQVQLRGLDFKMWDCDDE